MTASIADWIQAIATSIAALAALGVIWQLRLTRDQIRMAKEQQHQAVTWNKLSAAYTFLQGDQFARLEHGAADGLSKIGVELHTTKEPISEANVEAISRDAILYRQVRDYLNALENYASGVALGAIDDEGAYNLQASYIISHARIFKPFIERIRLERSDHEIYYELEKLALEWRKRFEDRRASRALALKTAQAEADSARQSAEERIRQETGVAKKY